MSVAGFSPQEVQQIAEVIRKIGSDVDRIMLRVVEGVKVTRTQVKEASAEARREFEKTEKTRQDLVKESLSAVEDMHKYHWESLARTGELHYRAMFGEFNYEWEQVLDKQQARWSKHVEELKRQFTQARGVFGVLHNAPTAALSAPSQLAGSVMGQAQNPTHFLGFLIHGKALTAQYAAQGMQAARAFAQVGDVGEGVAGRLTSAGQRFRAAWGEEGVAAMGQVTNAFAAMGISSEQAMKTATESNARFGKSVLETSYALDVLTNSAAGTFAGAIGKVMKQTGEDIDTVTSKVTSMAFAWRNSGANVSALISGLVEATTSLRMQGQTVDDLAVSYDALAKNYQKRWGKERGAAMAQAGVTSLAGDVGNLSTGMLGYLGMRMNPDEKDPIKAMMMARDGLVGGKGGHIFQATIEQLAKLATNFGPDAAHQRFGLEQLGISKDGALAISTMNSDPEYKAAVEKGLDTSQVMAKHMESLNKAFNDKMATFSPFERMMIEIEQAMARLLTGLLQAVIVGFMSLKEIILYALNSLPGGDSAKAEQHYQNAMDLIPLNDAAFEDMAGGVGNIFGTGKSWGQFMTRVRGARRGDAAPTPLTSADDLAYKQARGYVSGFHADADTSAAAVEGFVRVKRAAMARGVSADEATTLAIHATDAAFDKSGKKLKVEVFAKWVDAPGRPEPRGGPGGH